MGSRALDARFGVPKIWRTAPIETLVFLDKYSNNDVNGVIHAQQTIWRIARVDAVGFGIVANA